MHSDDGGETRTQPALQRVSWIEHDFDRNALDDLSEVAGRVIWGKQRELRAAGGRDLKNFAVQRDSGEGVDGDVGDVTSLHIGQLGFFEVSLDPDVSAHEIDDLHAWRYELPFLHVALAHGSFCRSQNPGVAEIDFGDNDGRFLGFDIGLIHGVFGVEGFPLPFRRFDVAWLLSS